MAYIGNTQQNQNYVGAVDSFSGNGSTVAFTLSRPVASVAQVQVTVNNVAQNPGSAFTVSGNTITFTGAPSSGTNNIYVYYTSPNTQLAQPGQGTVGTLQLADAGVTQAKLGTGVAGTGPAVWAWANATGQTLTFAATNVIQLNADTTPGFDTASCFDTTTYRFTPNVAGYYMVTGGISTTGYTSSGQYIPTIMKNGSTIVNGGFSVGLTGNGVLNNVSGLIYMNGSTDYMQLGAFDGQSTGTRSVTSGSGATYLMA